MKFFLLLALLSMTAAAGEFCDKLQQLPEATRSRLGPVIGVGASVTAGHGGVMGPAERLALILDVPYVSYAASGATSTASVGRWKSSDSRRCGTVVGVDLFFWDSVRGCSAEAVNKAVKLTQERKCHRAIFSNVPRLLGIQKSSCIGTINKTLDNSVSVDVLPVMEELQRDSRRASYFRADGIHLTEVGAEAATEKLCELLL